MPSKKNYWARVDYYRKRSREYAVDNPEWRRAAQRSWYASTPVHQMLRHARARAKKLGLPINITKRDVVIPDICPVLGIPIMVSADKSSPNSPTLDRIVPELGYIRGNVKVISHRANLLKNNASPEEIRLAYEYAKRETAVARWRGLVFAAEAIPQPLPERPKASTQLPLW